MLNRLIAGTLGVSVLFGAIALPAAAQTPSPAASPAPSNATQPNAAQPRNNATATTPNGTPLNGDQQELPPPPMPPVLPKVPAVAPGYAGPKNAPLPNGELVGVAQDPFVGIQLQDAITMALQRNPDLAVSESNNRIANYQIVAAKGAYDVNFMIEPSYSHSVSPAESPFATGPNGSPITQISDGAQAGFTGMTSNGGRYSLTASQSAVNNNSAYNSYNPFYQTAIALQFTQPLLKGTGGGDPVRRQLILANAQAGVQRAQLLTSASQTIANVSNTYWDLVAAWRNVGIQEEGLTNAQAQASSNGRLAKSGVAAPVDVVESYTQINVFQDNVFSALEQVQRLQTQLKSLVLGNPADPLWSANIVPTSAVLQLPAEPKLDDLIVTALKNRPEIAQLQAQRLVADENLGYAKNQLLPQLDLGVGITANGFAGVPQNLSGTPLFQTFGGEITTINALVNQYNMTATPGTQLPLIAANFGTTPAFQTGRMGQAWTNALDFRFPTYNINLTLKFPLGNRTAKAEYSIAGEQAKQVALQELTLLQRVRSESANAIQTLRETQYRLAAATAARTAAARVLLSERRRFVAGTSTTFLVLQRQLDLANTEGRELQAQTDLNKAVVELNRVAGTNFSAYNIDVQNLGGITLNTVTPTASVLPLPAGSQVSPPQPRR